MHENFGAVAGGDEAEAFALIVPFDGPSTTPGERQDMTTSRAVCRLPDRLALLPPRPHKGNAAILAGQKAVGGKIEVGLEIGRGRHGVYCIPQVAMAQKRTRRFDGPVAITALVSLR